MRGFRRPAIVFLALLLVLVVGVAGSAPAAEPRIVSLAPSVTETLFAVGAGSDLVGVTTFCDWPPAARRIARIGSYLKPNVEAIVARRPDLVIAVPSPGNHPEVVALERLGIRVVVVSEGPTLEDVFSTIRRIADVAGRGPAGESLVTGMHERLEGLRKRLTNGPRRRVLFIVDRNPLVVAGEGTLIEELLTLAGATNVVRGLGAWPRIGLEYLVRVEPEVLLDGTMGTGDERFYAGLDLGAVREGRFHTVRLDEVVRPGPRVVEGVERLARLIHPEAFE